MNFIEQQPTPMFSEDGRAYQTPGQFQSMGSRSETASFFDQMPTQGGLIESNNVSLRELGLEILNSQVPNHFMNYHAGHIRSAETQCPTVEQKARASLPFGL